MSIAHSPSEREIYQRAADFGEPMSWSDPFFQALIAPAARAAVYSLPRDVVSYTNSSGRYLVPHTICVKNDAQPEIFCTAIGSSYVVILNENLVLHLFNLSRQIFCMRDVCTSIGEPALERQQRKTYNRYNELLKIRLNIYEADTNCEFHAISPNKEPRCHTRQLAYNLLLWFMIEYLIVHEISHVAQGHVELSARERRASDSAPDVVTLNLSTLLEILADISAVQWFVPIDIDVLRRLYGRVAGGLNPTDRRALRTLAPALAHWAFASFTPEFCMDIRNHGTSIIGYGSAADEGSSHLQKNYRIGFVQDLARSALVDAGLQPKLTQAALERLTVVTSELDERLQFFNSDMLFNRILDGLIGFNIVNAAEKIDAWLRQSALLGVLPSAARASQMEILVQWANRANVPTSEQPYSGRGGVVMPV